MPKSFHITLVSTYDLGHQPFGLASPAAWLEQAGFSVRCIDLAIQPYQDSFFSDTDMVAFHLPMHTATRLAQLYAPKVKQLNPDAKLVFYGMYAATNAESLLTLGADYIFGGEYESHLTGLCRDLAAGKKYDGAKIRVSLDKQQFLLPQRSGLPPLDQYAHFHSDQEHYVLAGYTEASRGCKYQCRHCPIVPVYNGRFRVVQPEIVLDDIRQQVVQGARHITFGDPDFLNGPKHAEMVVRKLNEEFPHLSYDITVKVEHILRFSTMFRLFYETGCRLVTTAVESFDDQVLNIVKKGHIRDDIFTAIKILDNSGIAVSPTFIPFTPWTSVESYLEMLNILVEQDLVENVAPIQLAIRLLIPAGSALLGVEGLEDVLQPFDAEQLLFPWIHRDERVDELQKNVMSLVERSVAAGESRIQIFNGVYALAEAAAGVKTKVYSKHQRQARVSVPYLTEPWYC